MIVLVLAGAFPVWAVSRLDSSFGFNGRVAVELGVKNSAHAVLVQPDGKIVVAGTSAKGAALNFSLLRFNPDGSLDTSFNNEGVASVSVAKGDDEILAIGLLADGRLVAGGYSHNGTDRDFALACFLPDGSLDPGFGTNGVVVLPVGSGNDEITALTISGADMITVAGAAEGTTGRVLVSARYFPDGILDPGYGEQGISLIAVGKDAAIEGMVERSDGTLVVSGSYTDGRTASLMLVGLTADGLLDVGFGEQGVAVPASSFAASEGYCLAEDAEGRLYLAGSVGLAGKRDTALFRFTAAGKVDDSFGVGGAIITAVSQEDDVLYDLVVAKRGVVASGYTTDGGARQFLLATFRDNGGEPLIETAPVTMETSKVSEKSSSDEAIQEVKQNGSTRVQIRKLKVADARPSSLSPVDETIGSGWLSEMGRRLVSVAGRFGSLLITEAVAAESADATDESKSTEESATVKFVTTSFSAGESVSYALTTDASGNVIAVGTAEGTEASSIVAARYLADATTSNEAGYGNSHILTRTPTEVTRTTVITGGEIKTSFGKAVSKRGVVFSTVDTPVYSGGSDGDNNNDDDDDDTTTGPVVENHTDASFSSTDGTLKVTTDIAATCKYNIDTDVDYDEMEGSLTPTDEGMTHTVSLTNLIPGEKYNYYVRCSSNDSDEVNAEGTLVAFTVSSDATTFLPLRSIEAVGSLLSPAAAIAATTTTSDSTTTTTTATNIFGAGNKDEDEDEESDFVKEGETENGSGYGTFSARLEKLKPGTTYYVRAYALTSDGAVYYGPQMQFRTADACFVASASYGSLLHPGVRLLRQFRDTVLVGTAWGDRLIDQYYRLSPPIADIIAQNAPVRWATKALLLPLIGFSWLAIQLGMAKALLAAVCAATTLGWCAARFRLGA
jgi:uncharacterized delta-60 repeat protein